MKLLILQGAKLEFFYNIYPIPDTNLLLVFIFYFVSAILHILCTGYVVYTTIFMGWNSYQKLKFVKTQRVKFSTNDYIKSEIKTEVELVECEIGDHKLIKENKKYYFVTFGILTDTEFRQFVKKQIESRQQEITVMIEGVRHQIKILET